LSKAINKGGTGRPIPGENGEAGHLVLIDIAPEGKMTQVFPNARSLSTPTGGRPKSNYVEANRALLIPDSKNPYEGFEFKADAHSGR